MCTQRRDERVILYTTYSDVVFCNSYGRIFRHIIISVCSETNGRIAPRPSSVAATASVAAINNEALCRNENTRGCPSRIIILIINATGKLMEPVGRVARRPGACESEPTATQCVRSPLPAHRAADTSQPQLPLVNT